MKHLKKFESYVYLNDDDSSKIELFVREYIDNKNLTDESINNLEIKDFYYVNFDYRVVFDNLISIRIYTSGNIYYDVDKFCIDNGLNFRSTALRNSLENIITKIYNEIKLKNSLDEKLIELFNDNPYELIENYDDWKYDLNFKVKRACKNIIDTNKKMKKYNL